MALRDPDLGADYERSEDMPHYDELEAFQARLGADATAQVIDSIDEALDRVRVGHTVRAAQLIPGRTDVWSPPHDAIYATCERTPGVSDPYKMAALRLGQMVKAAVIDRANDWWSIWRTSEVRRVGGDEVPFAIYQRHGAGRP
jgi:hypothetical protein